jgi:hypothetical protein
MERKEIANMSKNIEHSNNPDSGRADLGTPDRFDVYYGMADSRIGVARLDVPEWLPPGARAEPARAKGSLQK